MSMSVSAVVTTSPSDAREETDHVFAGHARLLGPAARLAALIDPAFLVEVGWDSSLLVLRLPSEHRLLGRPICRAAGCEVTAPDRTHICAGCRHRLADAGISAENIVLLPARERPNRDIGTCQVSGCARQWVTGPEGLCRQHVDQRHALRLPLAAFLDDPRALPFAASGPCLVAACSRQRRHPSGQYCDMHQLRLRKALGANPYLDVVLWGRTEPAVAVGGQISLRGFAPLVVVQVLFGLQQRCRLEGVHTKEADFRVVTDDFRRQQIRSVADYRLRRRRNLSFAGLVNFLAAYSRRALTSPEAEAETDEWDLAIFGQSGTISFVGISQPWLRESAKRWAIDDLPKRRVRIGRRTSVGLNMRHHVGSLVRLSQSLRLRPDEGVVPAALGRTDVVSFLNRLAYLASTGKISSDARIRATREVRFVLTTIRALGLTTPGTAAEGLGQDFTISAHEIPDPPEPGECGRSLPPEIMHEICAHLHELRPAPMRAGIELIIDTGRRPEEIADLAFDCLIHDADGLPVLVYDNHKANRLGRQLPISSTTAEVITMQQKWVRAHYPDTQLRELKLLPTDRRNPNGQKSLTAFSIAFHHRSWVASMPVLHTADGIEFDKSRAVLYAYRHTYAQRHADAGVAIDVLRELMDHRKLDTTSSYYQVGNQRRRDAVDKVAAMQFNRNGDRVWRQAEELLDSEQARRAVGEVVVPFGVCTEPSNVQAGGHACPYRFRCVGCDHFRTDVSYLPDLSAHLADLLRNREKLLATQDLEDWARVEALPSEAEITRTRRLITSVEAGLEQLSPTQRTEIEEAVALLRNHRTVSLGMPQVRQPRPDTRLERS